VHGATGRRPPARRGRRSPRRDGDERSDGAAEGGADEDRDEHEQRVDVELIALDDRGDHVPLQVLDQDRRQEREHEGPRAVERRDREEWDAREPAADERDQLSEGHDHGERDREGTPITISETYVSAPTIAITITFARR
jgi:hypothetical protein